MKRAAVAIALSASLVDGLSAQIQFHAAVDYAVGKNPEGGALLDIDGDGDLDLAVSIEAPDAIRFLSNSAGAFQLGSLLPTGSATSPEGLAPGDFDGDGRVDLAAALFSANQVQLVHGQAGGGFALGATFAVQVEPSVIVAADFDADGRLDAAVNNRVSGTVSVLRNDGAGGFLAAVHFAVGAETRCVAAADLDLDGFPDLAVSARDDRRVRLLRSLGNGSFATLKDLSLGSILEPQGVAVADYDVDGAPDVVTATSGTFPLQEHPSVFLQNNGSSHWVGPINGSVLPGVSPIGIAAADLDLDGVPDAATSNADTNDVSLMRGSGIAGIFLAGTQVKPIGENPEAPILLAGDLDANGAPDLVALDVDGDSVSVLLNAVDGQVCQADIGFGGPGTSALSLCGAPLASGKSAALELVGAPPSAPLWIAVGSVLNPTPLFGGTLVPVPWQVVLGGLHTDAAGSFVVPGVAGGGGPATVYVQAVVLDLAQPGLVGFSNALAVALLP